VGVFAFLCPVFLVNQRPLGRWGLAFNDSNLGKNYKVPRSAVRVNQRNTDSVIELPMRQNESQLMHDSGTQRFSKSTQNGPELNTTSEEYFKIEHLSLSAVTGSPALGASLRTGLESWGASSVETLACLRTQPYMWRNSTHAVIVLDLNTPANARSCGTAHLTSSLLSPVLVDLEDPRVEVASIKSVNHVIHR
jgi:hypothetical protein